MFTLPSPATLPAIVTFEFSSNLNLSPVSFVGSFCISAPILSVAPLLIVVVLPATSSEPFFIFKVPAVMLFFVPPKNLPNTFVTPATLWLNTPVNPLKF